MLSVHTSPLDQPGTGDAGGMNVYVVELSRRLASLGIEVEVFTRATGSDQPPAVELAPGVLVRHLTAGPFEELPKQDLPGQLCALTSGVLRAEAARTPKWYDLVHSHYWLSGQVGWLAKERWGVPLVHAMHTMAKVKNASLAEGDSPEPALRVIGETQVVEQADRLVANTDDEADALVDLYGADPAKIAVVHPGVDLEVFAPGDRAAARAALGIPIDAEVVLFAGRIQPLKAPDVVLKAAAELVRRSPRRAERLVVAIVGGTSGPGSTTPTGLGRLAARLGIDHLVRFVPPVPQPELALWYRAASVTVVPSYNESFGLVAIESQACGTPVVAAAAGGLRTAVLDGQTGSLVDGHDPLDYASAIEPLLTSPAWRHELGVAARQHAEYFGWAVTAARTVDVYADVLEEQAAAQRQLAVVGR
jgi:D-inositol-3-phosphate glycosyltransferase